MRGAVYYGIEDLRVEETVQPSLPAGGLLVRIDGCLICGTDVKAFYQGNPRFHPPIIIGHEFAGVVAEVGDGVEGFSPGDRIVMATTIGCGGCEFCRRGESNLCPSAICIGTDLPGAYAPFMAVPARALRNGNVLRIPDEVPWESACVAEPLSCAINAQTIASVGMGDTVVVVGGGPLGILHTQVARARGATQVILSQRSPTRLRWASAFDIDRIVDIRSESLRDVVMELTDGRGAEVVIVTAPNNEAQEQALELVAKNGRLSLFSSVPRENPTIRLDSRFIHYRQIRVCGSSDSTPEHVRLALELLRAGRISTEALITHRLPLSEIRQGIEIMKRSEGLKVLIRPE